jgi:hypothetical protein
MQSENTVQRAKEIVFSQLDNELLALDSQAGYCYSLNETAGMVWELIEKPMTIGEIVMRLSEAFNVDEITCQREVIELLGGLHEAGLVKVNDAQVD